MTLNKKIKHFAPLFLLLLLLFAHSAGAVQPPPSDLAVGGVTFSPPTIAVGGQATVTFATTPPGSTCNGESSGCGVFADNDNAFLIFLPSTNSIVINNPNDYWTIAALTVYGLPTCGNAGLTISDACVLANAVWSPNPSITLQVQTPQGLLPNVNYYFIGVLDPSLESCIYDNVQPACQTGVPDCTYGSSLFCAGTNPPQCNTYGGPSLCSGAGYSSPPPTIPEYAGGATLSLVSGTSEKLTIGPTVLLPGASSDIDFNYSGVSCNTESFVQMSAQGTPCVVPDTLASSPAQENDGFINVFCSEDTTFLTTGLQYRNINGIQYQVQINAYGTIRPWPPCITDAAQVFNSFDMNNNIATPYCQLSYFTNTIYTPQGTYNICGSYQILAPSPSGSGLLVPQGQANPVVGNIVVAANAMWGPSYGLFLTFGPSTFPLSTTAPLQVTLNPDEVPKSPFVNYFTSIGQSAPSSTSLCGGSLNGGYNCYFELASGTDSNGCVPPLVLQAQDDYCSNAGTSLPCLITTFSGSSGPSDTASIDPQTYLPQGHAGSYLVCAYDYFTPSGSGGFGPDSLQLQYPSNPSQGYDYGVNPTLGYYASPPPTQTAGDGASLAIFFASAGITCNGAGQCTTGQSTEQAPTTFIGSTGAPLTALGSVNINPYTIQQGSSATITANAYGLSSVPLRLYVIPYTNTNLINAQQACTATLSPAYGPCTDSPGDANGCYMGYLPSTTAPYSCTSQTPALPGSTCGYGAGVSTDNCQPYVPPGCTEDPTHPGYVDCAGTQSGTQSESQQPQGVECSIGSQSPADFPPGTYLYCLMYDNGYVGAGALTINPSQSNIGSSNGGTANAAPLTSSLCTIFAQIEAILAVLSITLLLLGAVLYELGQLLPAQARGTIQGYAMGMILGGLVGAGLAAFSYVVVSITVYGQLTNLLAACSV